jgi:hypothetical protein
VYTFYISTTVVYPRIGKKVRNNYFNVSGILGRVTIKFWKILAFFINNLKTFRHCYWNIIIIRSFIYCIYQRLRENFESYFLIAFFWSHSVSNVFEVREC